MGPIIKTLIFTILVPGTFAVLVPYWLVSANPRLHVLGEARFVGFVSLVVGGAIYLKCAWDFATVGKGSPAPFAPPENLVIRGLYRYVRNPMYVGVLLVFSGEAIAFESFALVIYACGAWLLFHLFVVFYEEPHLRAIFGDSYEDYKRRVPRWLPKLGGR